MAETAAIGQLKQNQNTVKTFMARMNKISRSYEKRQRAMNVIVEKSTSRLEDSCDKLVKAMDRNTSALQNGLDSIPMPPEKSLPEIKIQPDIYVTCQSHLEKSSGTSSAGKGSVIQFPQGGRSDVFKNVTAPKSSVQKAGEKQESLRSKMAGWFQNLETKLKPKVEKIEEKMKGPTQAIIERYSERSEPESKADVNDPIHHVIDPVKSNLPADFNSLELGKASAHRSVAENAEQTMIEQDPVHHVISPTNVALPADFSSLKIGKDPVHKNVVGNAEQVITDNDPTNHVISPITVTLQEEMDLSNPTILEAAIQAPVPESMALVSKQAAEKAKSIAETVANTIESTTQRVSGSVEAMKDNTGGVFKEVKAKSEETKMTTAGKGDAIEAKASSVLKNINKKAEETAKSAEDTVSNSMENSVDKVAQKLQQAKDKVREFSERWEVVKGKLEGIKEKLAKLSAQIFNMANAKKVLNFAVEASGLALDQQMVELKVKTVMEQGGGTKEGFEAIKDRALELQDTTAYSDNVMLAGAAELFKGTGNEKATSMLMGTLADFAAGSSGGGAVDANSMAGYASQLAAAMQGDFSALESQGLQLSAAQKEIIKNGDAVSQAMILDEVVSQSWNGLAEQVANTPQGVLAQMQNQFMGLKESLGAQLSPAITAFLQAVQQGMPIVQELFGKVADALQVIFAALTQVAEIAVLAGTYMMENWASIEPFIWGLVAALAAYNAVMLISQLRNSMMAAATMLHTLWLGVWSGVMAVATAVQWAFNAAMASCPIFWLIAAILIVIAVIYMIIKAVQAVGESSVSVLEVIVQAIAFAVSLIWNMIIGLVSGIIQLLWTMFVEPFIGIVEWILNVANGGFDSFGGAVANLIGQIISWFLSLGKVVTKIIDAIFGTDWTSGLSSLQAEVVQWGKNEESITLDREAPDLLDFRLEQDVVADAMLNGIDKFKGMLDGFGGGMEDDDFNGALDNLGSIADTSGQTAANTMESTNTMERSTEDLKYLRDIAERDAINQYTTAEITVNQTNNNKIDSNLDVDGIMTALSDDFAEMLYVSAEGVHA